MCYTLAGRLQTRLLALAGPFLLMAAGAAVTRHAGPLGLVALMLLLGLLLDASLYARVIGYQPRWLTVALGLFEFGVLIGLMSALSLLPDGLRPPPIDLLPDPAVQDDPGLVLALYVTAWALGWLTTHILLPWRYPRWTEDGGELRPAVPQGR